MKFHLKKGTTSLEIANIFQSYITSDGFTEVPKFTEQLDFNIATEKMSYSTLHLQKQKKLTGKFTNIKKRYGLSFVFDEIAQILTIEYTQENNSNETKRDIPISRLLSQILQYADDDAGLPILFSPIILTKQIASILASIINRNTYTELPVVVISSKENGEIEADPGYIAEDLQGIAHIIVSLSTEDDEYLANLTYGAYLRNGFVDIYSAKTSSLITIPPNNVDANILRSKIKDIVFRQVIKNIEKPNGVNEVNNSVISQNTADNSNTIKMIREENRKLREENEEWARSMEEETKRTAKQIESLYKKCEEQKRQLQLQKELKNNNKGEAILFSGDINEFFIGEQREFVISSLKKAIKNTERYSRRYDVLKSILDANISSGALDELRARIEDILSPKKELGEREFKQLESLGFVITHSGSHYRMSYHGDSRYIKTIASTPSDCRAMRNNFHQITNSFF